MALTPAEIAAMERMETSRCPRSSIKSHDPAIEARRQETLRRVRDHYKVPGQKKRRPRPKKERAPPPLDVDYGFLVNGEPAANLGRELRCGRCFQVIAAAELLCPVCSGVVADPAPTAYPPLDACGLTELQIRKRRADERNRNTFDGNRAVGAAEALQQFRDTKKTAEVGKVAMRDRRALEARRDLAARVLFADGSVVAGIADAVEESKVRAARSAGSDSVVTDDSRAVRAAIGRLYDPERQAGGKDFYDVLAKVGVRPLYGRYLREGPRRGDGAYAGSNTIRALEFFRNTLPRHQRELKLRRQFSARSSDAVEAVDLQPLSREAAPKMLRMLELGMRKAGAGAGLADSPLARGPDDRETRFGTRSEWADFADFAKERKGKDHAYERAKAEKAMAEGGDGWRPGAHDEALDSLLDRFDDDDDPIVMRELAPTPEVTFDVADMPEAPPDGRPMLFGPPPGGRPLVGGRPGTSAAPRAESADARVAQYSPTPSPLRPGTASSRAASQASSPTWYGDAREGEAKRLIRIKATTRGGSRRRAARVSKVRANMRANTFSNRVSRQSKKGAGGQFFK